MDDYWETHTGMIRDYIFEKSIQDDIERREHDIQTTQ